MFSRTTRTFVALVMAHCLVDCSSGAWPIFKYLANLDLAWAGMIATFTVFIGAGLQPVFGFWSDHGWHRPLIVAGAALACMSALLGPIAIATERVGETAAYLLMLAVMLTVAVGRGMFHPAGASLAGNIVHERRSTLLAVFVAGGMIGLSLSQGLFSKVYRLTSGHTQWMLVPALLIVLWVGWWCAPSAGDNGHRKPLNIRVALRNLAPFRRQLAILYLYEMFMASLSTGFIFLMPEFLNLRGYPHWMVHGGGMLLWVAGSVALMVPGGHIADRTSSGAPLVVFTALAAILYLLMILLPSMPVFAFGILIFVAGGFVGTTNPMGVAMGQRLAPQHASVISGILMGLAWSVGGISMSLVGTLAKLPGVGIVTALAILSAATLAALALSLMFFRHKSRG